MGATPSARVIQGRTRPLIELAGAGSGPRLRPRSFAEWAALRRWKKLPPGEVNQPGFVLRLVRLDSGLTQARLARRLGISQQAVAQGERWAANPTLRFVEAWSRACGRRLDLSFVARPKVL